MHEQLPCWQTTIKVGGKSNYMSQSKRDYSKQEWTFEAITKLLRHRSIFFFETNR